MEDQINPLRLHFEKSRILDKKFLNGYNKSNKRGKITT